MKQVKIMMIALMAVLIGTTFTSCLDSDSGDSLDAYTYVTADSFYGSTLTTDAGHTLIPSNPSVLKYTDGTPITRCIIGFNWNEGVVFDEDLKKTYAITIKEVHPLLTRNYCNRPDTIEYDYPISELGNFWGANGKYLELSWKFNFTSAAEKIGFELYPYEVEDNVLIMRLRQSLGSSGYYTGECYMSFLMPSIADVNDMLGTDLQQLENDSIYMKIASKKHEDSDELTISKAIKVKIRSY